MQRHPDFELEDVQAPWFVQVGVGQFRLWPHKLLGEGHFAAVLRKRGEQEPSGVPGAGERLPKQWVDFAKTLGIDLPEGKAVSFGTTLYWAPAQMPDLKGIKVLRPGLELGEVKKDRFEPAHALALWLKACKNSISFPADSNQIRAYMHGDVVAAQVRGWCVVQVDGYSIGWGKGDGTMLKNHYPKGLRR